MLVEVCRCLVDCLDSSDSDELQAKITDFSVTQRRLFEDKRTEKGM